MTSQRFRRAEAVHTRVFDGELVVLDLDRGEYYALDVIGTELWHGLESGKTVAQITDSIVERYAVSHERALADVTVLCEDLLQHGLIVNERG